MTHCSGYRAAVVARSRTVRSVGIDAEPDAALPPAMLDLVLRSEERARLRTISEAFPDRHWDRILFCAKEAVFKAWFPIARSWLDFLDVSVAVRADGTFRALVHASPVAGVGPVFDGRWAVANGLILTATSVSPSKPDAVEPAAHGDDRVWRKNFREALA
jgi:4'-phosphopantetheinyl transferase EntD